MDILQSNNLVNSSQDDEIEESDKPPSTRPRPARLWRVAIIANVKGDNHPATHTAEDAGAEFDKPETIQAIQAAIESDGHTTQFINADASLPARVQEYCPDICFNIAEGLGGDAREAQVPALLEMLHIPYTASRVLANAIGLDKTVTKRIWRQAGLPTAPFQEFSTGCEPLARGLDFPLFVKPSREGTGMGMGTTSIVRNEGQLREQLAWVINAYKQPALVETYLPGREFTVAVVGRPGAIPFSRKPEGYLPDGFRRFPVMEVENSHSATPGVYGHLTKTLGLDEEGVPSFLCPAPIDSRLRTQLQELAIRAHRAVDALDVSRVDLRLDVAGKPRLIEINALPGLSPGFSDLCLIAAAGGWSYEDLILEILYLGASRFGLVIPATQLEAPRPIRIPGLPRVPVRVSVRAGGAAKA